MSYVSNNYEPTEPDSTSAKASKVYDAIMMLRQQGQDMILGKEMALVEHPTEGRCLAVFWSPARSTLADNLAAHGMAGARVLRRTDVPEP